MLGKGHKIKNFNLLDFSAIRAHLETAKQIKRAATDGEKATAKSVKEELTVGVLIPGQFVATCRRTSFRVSVPRNMLRSDVFEFLRLCTPAVRILGQNGIPLSHPFVVDPLPWLRSARSVEGDPFSKSDRRNLTTHPSSSADCTNVIV